MLLLRRIGLALTIAFLMTEHVAAHAGHHHGVDLWHFITSPDHLGMFLIACIGLGWGINVIARSVRRQRISRTSKRQP